MLSPEIWNFQEPQSTFHVEKSDQNKNCASKKINQLNFNHLVTVTLPDVHQLPDRLSEVLNTDSEYYKIENLNLSDCIDDVFLTSFIKHGRLTLLSINTRIDCDNCIAITPKGQMILNLDKNTYQTFGVEGKVTHFQSKIKSRYIVSIDLTADHIINPQKAQYIRTKSCLSQLGTFKVIANWEPSSKEICPSSFAKYFSKLNCTVRLCQPKFESATTTSVKVPELTDDDDSVEDFAEWLGMVALQADLTSGGADSYINTYETPQLNRIVERVKHLQWRGFFTGEKLEQLVAEVLKFNKVDERFWIAVYVQGFSDAPIGWNNEEHHYFTNGDNGYLLVFKGDNRWVCTQECSKKIYK